MNKLYKLTTILKDLQELQRQYMSVKYGCTSLLSPASEHPLQDVDSPSPIRPLHTGSTSALYTPSMPVILKYIVYIVFHLE